MNLFLNLLAGSSNVSSKVIPLVWNNVDGADATDITDVDVAIKERTASGLYDRTAPVITLADLPTSSSPQTIGVTSNEALASLTLSCTDGTSTDTGSFNDADGNAYATLPAGDVDTKQTLTIGGALEGGKTYTTCTVTGTDSASNSGTATFSSFTFADTVAPTITSIDVSSDNQNPRLAKQSDVVTITVTADEPLTVLPKPTVNIGGSSGTSISAANITAGANNPSTGTPSATGTFTFTVPASTTGVVGVSVGTTTADRFNNTLATAYSTIDANSGVTVDTTAPTKPTSIVLKTSSDTGSSTSDNITKDTSPTFTVSGLTSGDHVSAQALDNSNTYNALGIAAGTSLDINLIATPVADGTYTIKATAIDAAGNRSPESDALTFTVDTTSPVAPAVPVLKTASDTGSSTSDNITSDTTPTITVSGAAGFLVEAFAGSTSLGTATVASGATTAEITPTTAISTDGVYQITSTETDLAGNTSPASAALPVTIDTTSPTIIIIRTAGDDNAAATTGRKYIAVATDITSSVDTFTHSVALADCSTFSAGTAYDGSEVDAGTNKLVCFAARDTAGNLTSGASSANAIQGIGSASFTTGTLDSGTYYIQSGTRTFTGTTASGVTIHLYDAATGGTALYSGVTATSAISVDINIPTDLTVLYGSITPSGAAETPRIKLFDVTVDDTPIEIPAADGGSGLFQILSSADDTGVSNIDGITNVNKASVLVGVVYLRALTEAPYLGECSINDGNAYAPEVTVVDGFQCSVPFTTDGVYEINHTIYDKAGNSTSITTTLIRDTVVPTITVLSPKLIKSETDAKTVTLSVEGDGGLSPNIYSYANSTYSLLANPSSITATIPASQAEGTYTITTPKIRDTAGNETSITANIDNTAPTLNSVSIVGGKKSFAGTFSVTHGNNAGNINIEESVSVKFTGECANFDVVELGSIADGSSSTATSYTVDRASANKGTYTDCTAIVVDTAGNESSPVNLPTFTIRGSGGGVAVSRLSKPTPTPVVNIFDEEIIYVQGEETYPETVYSETIYSTGSVNSEVQQLQRDLNKLGYTVSSTPGTPGSAGYETTYFGPATKKALIQYQAAKGLPQTGILDEATKLSLQKDLGIEPQQQDEVQQQEVRALISNIKSQIQTLIVKIEALLEEQRKEAPVSEEIEEPVVSEVEEPVVSETEEEPTVPVKDEEVEIKIIQPVSVQTGSAKVNNLRKRRPILTGAPQF